MAHSSLDRLAEEGPFNQRMACSSVGNTNDDTGDKHFFYFAVYKAKSHPSISSYYLHSDLVGEGLLLCPLYGYGKVKR